MKQINQFLAALTVLVLAGCQSSNQYVPSQATPTTVTPLLVSEIVIDVGTISAEDKSTQWVSTRFPDQVRAWLQQRFSAKAGERRGFINIRQAVVRETQLPQVASVAGWFSKQPSEQYDAALDVAFELRDEFGFAQNMASAHIQRTTTVMDGASMQDRQGVVQKLINQILVELDAELIRNMRIFLPQIMTNEEK